MQPKIENAKRSHKRSFILNRSRCHTYISLYAMYEDLEVLEDLIAKRRAILDSHDKNELKNLIKEDYSPLSRVQDPSYKIGINRLNEVKDYVANIDAHIKDYNVLSQTIEDNGRTYFTGHKTVGSLEDEKALFESKGIEVHQRKKARKGRVRVEELKDSLYHDD